MIGYFLIGGPKHTYYLATEAPVEHETVVDGCTYVKVTNDVLAADTAANDFVDRWLEMLGKARCFPLT